MPLPVSDIINECASEIGDEPQGRFTAERWLQAFNKTLSEMTLKYRILEQDQTFDVLANEDAYLFPEDMVQMKRLRYTGTPSDTNSYLPIGEMFQDEVRAAESMGKSTGDQFQGYWARSQFLQVVPKPTTAVTDGLLISYWRLAVRVSSSVGDLELPAMYRDLVVARMVIFAKRSLSRYAEYVSDLAAWKNDLEEVAEAVDDRSDDRRSALRPASAIRGNRGMR